MAKKKNKAKPDDLLPLALRCLEEVQNPETGITELHYTAPSRPIGEAMRQMQAQENEQALDTLWTGFAYQHQVSLVMTEVQQLIWQALDGKAMDEKELMYQLGIGSKQTLYGKKGKGGLTELRNRKLVDHHKSIGFYRSDSPPPRE